MKIQAESLNYFKIVRSNILTDCSPVLYPYVRDNQGSLEMEIISPNHGRSFLLKKEAENHWIIGKGNGLCYSTHSSLITSSHDSDTWGCLSLPQAVRDFDIGNEISNLGIKTNKMEYVLKLPSNVIFNGKDEIAALLQYSVECPFRIVDFAFIPKQLLKVCVDNWQPVNKRLKVNRKHLIAADRLFYNLYEMHRNGILHNAITPQNYTWALEIVDFEASHTPKTPFGTEQYQYYIPMLMDMEVLQTYEIVNYISWCLHEICDYAAVEHIMRFYGFNLNSIP